MGTEKIRKNAICVCTVCVLLIRWLWFFLGTGSMWWRCESVCVCVCVCVSVCVCREARYVHRNSAQYNRPLRFPVSATASSVGQWTNRHKTKRMLIYVLRGAAAAALHVWETRSDHTKPLQQQWERRSEVHWNALSFFILLTIRALWEMMQANSNGDRGSPGHSSEAVTQSHKFNTLCWQRSGVGGEWCRDVFVIVIF